MVGLKRCGSKFLPIRLVTPKSDRGQGINIPMEKEEDSVDYTNCSHLDSTTFSGDLICLNCGKVLQSNSQLSLDPVYLDRDTNRHSSQGVIPRQLITHQEREESSLRFTARKLISSFALKPALEALELMHSTGRLGSQKIRHLR